jgi:hypothetical protein
VKEIGGEIWTNLRILNPPEYEEVVFGMLCVWFVYVHMHVCASLSVSF